MAVAVGDRLDVVAPLVSGRKRATNAVAGEQSVAAWFGSQSRHPILLQDAGSISEEIQRSELAQTCFRAAR